MLDVASINSRAAYRPLQTSLAEKSVVGRTIRLVHLRHRHDCVSPRPLHCVLLGTSNFKRNVQKKWHTVDDFAPLPGGVYIMKATIANLEE